ncbi:cytochrome P450 4d1-like isoform X2 [Haematobia irritans]|uniref:cytochrome P450 4d1-like isoform X2 n=1 Tax=Haematobia irritans TaxID=7368 RepID=UPI003F508E58
MFYSNWLLSVLANIHLREFIGLMIGLVLVIAYGIYHFKFKHMIEVTANIPSSPSLPLLGHGHYFLYKAPHEILMATIKMSELYTESMKCFKFWLGPDLNMISIDLKDIEIMLGGTQHLEKAKEYTFLEPWLGDGLLLSHGRKWHQRRKILTPAFHFSILGDFVQIFEKQSRILVDIMDKESRKSKDKGFCLEDLINLCSLDIICESSMGVSINAQTHTESKYVKALRTITMVLHKRIIDVIHRFYFTYRFTKLAREEEKALATLHGFTQKVIEQRREELLKTQSKQSQTSQEDIDIGIKRRSAFLDILLQSTIDGKPLSNMDIREEVDTFMFEGHDTVSSGIIFCFYNLARYPEYQQKCFEEIIQIMGKDKSKPVTMEDINQMHYVELCVKESLRLYPSVPLFGRKIREDFEMNGKILPAGTNFGISPFLMGRCKEYFPEPELFKPERFDEGCNMPYLYTHFSAGSRNCIGQRFAMLEIKTVLANVLRHYELDYIGDKTKEALLVAELVLKFKDRIMFTVKPRVY